MCVAMSLRAYMSVCVVVVNLCGDTYEYENRYKNIACSTDEIFKCKKHTILVDDYGYIWIIMVQ